MKYYSLKKLLSMNCRYNICFGMRSNGKTFAVLLHSLEDFIKNGNQLAVIRRYREDLKGKNAMQFMEGLSGDGNGKNRVEQLTGGKFDRVVYHMRCWYLAYWDETLQRNILDDRPFAYSFALTEMEHDKGSSYLGVKNILFDEFITRNSYLPDEFVLFMNVLSTIIRHRDDVKIFMCANTVNKYCPYFNEMGLKHVREMKQGDIDLYKFGNDENCLRIAVEYCNDNSKDGKPSDVYFAFDNKNLKLNMITSGSWELDVYPHNTTKYEKKDIIFNYFIEFEESLLQADIVIKDNKYFTFIHLKTTPLKDEEEDYVFKTNADQRINYLGRLTKPTTKLGQKIKWFFDERKVFYQSNEIGEIVRNYLIWSDQVIR